MGRGEILRKQIGDEFCMKNSWNIFRADWRRLTASVVAVVVMLGLCLVPCLYAWFNILPNWDPYGVGSTSRIKVAVSNEALRAQLETAIAGLEKLDAAVDELLLSGVKELVLYYPARRLNEAIAKSKEKSGIM